MSMRSNLVSFVSRVRRTDWEPVVKGAVDALENLVAAGMTVTKAFRSLSPDQKNAIRVALSVAAIFLSPIRGVGGRLGTGMSVWQLLNRID